MFHMGNISVEKYNYLFKLLDIFYVEKSRGDRICYKSPVVNFTKEMIPLSGFTRKMYFNSRFTLLHLIGKLA